MKVNLDAIPADLKLPTLRMLAFAMHRPQPTVGEVAAHLGVTPAAVTGILDAAEQLGYAARGRSADRRVTTILLTEHGRQTMLELQK
jgi:DNA-binding MarR family transcriptional regulator